jgi:hypothetical protein
MVIRSNTVQAGCNFDQDDSIIIDNLSTGTTSSFNRYEIPMKNDGDPTICKNLSKSTHNNMTHTNEEGRRTTSPGKNKETKEEQQSNINGINHYINRRKSQ